VGIALFVLAPNVAALTAAEHRVPNFEQACQTMEGQGPELMARSASGQQVPKELAAKVRESALTCQTFASNPTQAASAERYVLAALRASGTAAVCRASWQCPPEHVCETSTGECLRYGVYCTTPQHCAGGNECDVARNRCVARESFSCSAASSCQSDETCHERRCVPLEQRVGKPCKVEGADGICEDGTYRSDGRGGLLCKSSKQAVVESCNGIDDDCNGTIDDGLFDGKPCEAQARGQCRRGETLCRGGKLTCSPGLPKAEICGNAVDEDCDGYLDESCDAQRFKEHEYHFGTLSNCAELRLGGPCPPGHTRDGVCRIVDGPIDGQAWMKGEWASRNPRDCTCRFRCEKNWFADNTWKVEIWSRPERRRAPR
jgi:hypothetical protein